MSPRWCFFPAPAVTNYADWDVSNPSVTIAGYAKSNTGQRIDVDYESASNAFGAYAQTSGTSIDATNIGWSSGSKIDVDMSGTINTTPFASGYPYVAYWNETDNTWRKGTADDRGAFKVDMIYSMDSPTLLYNSMDDGTQAVLFYTSDPGSVSGWTAYDGPDGSGSDWDTEEDGIVVDNVFDTSRSWSTTITPGGGHHEYTIIKKASSTYNNTRWTQINAITDSGAGYSSAAITAGFDRSLGTAYRGWYGGTTDHAAGNVYPPYIAIWCEFPNDKLYGTGKWSRGWIVLELESSAHSVNGFSIAYRVVHSPEGANYGLPSSLGSVVFVALDSYDGNAANWRDYDYDNWGLIQRVRYTMSNSTSSPIAISSIADVGTTTLQAFKTNHPSWGNNIFIWTGDQPRCPAGDYGNSVGATNNAFPTGTDCANYWSRFMVFKTKVGSHNGVAYSGNPHFKIGRSAQPTYVNSGSISSQEDSISWSSFDLHFFRLD